MTNLVVFAFGLVFGVGLILSGMTHPAKVIGFLDVTGRWDPSLALVMAGAIAVAIVPFQRAGKAVRRWPGATEQQPESSSVDGSLLVGSALFGIGWGLSGFCPGPALVGSGAGYLPAVVFTIAMVFGMETHNWLVAASERRAQRKATAAASFEA